MDTTDSIDSKEGIDIIVCINTSTVYRKKKSSNLKVIELFCMIFLLLSLERREISDVSYCDASLRKDIVASSLVMFNKHSPL